MAYTENKLPTDLEAKATPVDADIAVVGDSADSGRVKKTTWTQMKAFLKTYNDTLYAAVLGADDNYVTDAEKAVVGNTSGTNTGDQSTIVGITGTKAQFDTAVSDGDIQYVGDAPTSHTHLLAEGATDVTSTASEVNLLDLGGMTAGDVLSADNATTASWKAQAGGAPEGSAVLSTGETGATKFLREDGDGSCSWQTTPSAGNPEGTDVVSTGETGGVKYLREDGDGSCSWQTPAGSGDVIGPASAVDSNFAAFDTTTGKLVKDSGSAAATFAPALGADDNYVTDAEKVVIGNTSGANTGDQDLSALAPKADPTFTGEIGIGAVNVSETELGILEGATVTTTELNLLDGITTLSGSNTGDESTATDTAEGVVELATDAEMTTGTATNRAVTPANAKVELDKKANLAGATFTGAVVAPDHGTAATDQVVNVSYGTSATPQTASTTTEGSLYVQYTA